jgi:endo-1,4-beta-D-glucanase Y
MRTTGNLAGALGVLMLLIAGIAATCPSAAVPAGTGASTAPRRPFPAHAAYAPGTLRPSRFTQAELDDHVRQFYQAWKRDYLVPAGVSASGRPRYRVAFGTGSSATVSEGQGYGMIIAAYLAGHDPAAQMLFDGLWAFALDHPSGGDPRLMTWKVDGDAAVGGNASAFDGDADMAYGLLLADAQWGSDGAVDYRQAALTLLDGILAATIGATSRLPLLGDWVEPDGTPYSQGTPRTSDIMPAHFRAFGRATGDARWAAVIRQSQAAILAIQAEYSPLTGLVPDFLVGCAVACAPAPAGFLEGPHDGHYHYNAGRVPWRIGSDAVLNGDAASTAIVRRLVAWLNGAAHGSALQIKAGYQLDGTANGDYFTTFFAAPVGVAAMASPTQQAFLDDIYLHVHDRHEGYYEDSVTLLSLLVLTGNAWDPTATTSHVPFVAR